MAGRIRVANRLSGPVPYALPPERSAYWSHAGVTLNDGIPVRSTYTTLEPSGGIDGPAIQDALDACPPGSQVVLAAGTFKIRDNAYVRIPSYVTLKGSGAGVTTVKTVRADETSPSAVRNLVDGYLLPSYSMPILIGPGLFPHWNVSSLAVDLASDAVQGSDTITVDDASSFSVGQFVVLDEDHFFSGAWHDRPDEGGQPNANQIWRSDRVSWGHYNPPIEFTDFYPYPNPDAYGVGGVPPGNPLGWFARGGGRNMGEVKEILAINGNNIQFTSPCHITYRAGAPYYAQLCGCDSTHVVEAGVESMTIRHGSDGAVQFRAAAHCWAKNIEVLEWLGHGVQFSYCFRCELRDSYLHYGAWPVPGGGGYAIALNFCSSEILIENNVIGPGGVTGPGTLGGTNKCMVANSAGAGSVVGYNYATDACIFESDGTQRAWFEVGLNGSHMTGSHSMLFEGNHSQNADSDNTHGSAWRHTFYRNHLTGAWRDVTASNVANKRCAGLMFGTQMCSFVGNVWGEAGQMSGWSSTATTFSDPTVPVVHKLGYDPGGWNMDQDPTVPATTLEVENYDHAASARTNQTTLPLPASLYRQTIPSFFGANPWPWVDPVTGTTQTLPAKARYDAGTPNVVP